MDEPIDLRALLEQERSARLRAERAGRLKDEFLEALAHELRAPLTAILGWSRLMELGRLGSEQEIRAGGERLARNARVLAHILDDLLDLSAVTSGTMRIEAEETDACDVVGAVIDVLQPTAQSKGVTLRKTLASPQCMVFGDPQRLQQAIWHLLSNAIKFTPRGGHAAVSVCALGGSCEILIQDSGAGIASELLPFVFDHFWRAESPAGSDRQGSNDGIDTVAVQHRYSGLGIGLALAKRLIELHGGQVSAESEGLNRGATFRIVLPRVAPHAQPAAEGWVRSIAVDTAEPGSSLLGLRVLVVDDEPDTLDLLRRVLGDSRAQVATAASVEAALAALGTFEPHVLISDVSMPGRDGYELIRAVRSTRGLEGLPAAALTAYARPDDARRAREAGFQVHLSKPVEPDELVRLVARLAGRTAQAAL